MVYRNILRDQQVQKKFLTKTLLKLNAEGADGIDIHAVRHPPNRWFIDFMKSFKAKLGRFQLTYTVKFNIFTLKPGVDVVFYIIHKINFAS